MSPRPDIWSRAMAHRDAPDPVVAIETRHVSVIDGRGALSVRSISLRAIESLAGVSAEDVDPRGAWVGPRRHAGRYDVTAILLGDPPFERSALAQRGS